MQNLSVLGGALRYEFRMQFRRFSVWLVLLLVSIPIIGLWFLFIGPDLVARGRPDLSTAVRAVLLLAQFMAWFMPIGFGLILADRLGRDRQTRTAELLETYPGALSVRLLGKFLGSVLATLLPVGLVYLVIVAYILVSVQDLRVLITAVEAFGAVLLPGLLFAAGFSIALPVVIKTWLYQVLFVGYWFWANMLTSRFHVPTLSGTMLNATGAWAQEAFFHFQIVELVAQHPDQLSGVMSIVLLIGLGLLALVGAWGYLRLQLARR